MSITMYGTYWCSDCKRAKQFFGDHRVPYDFIDVDGNPEAIAFIERVNEGNQQIPVIEFDDGDYLVEPSNRQLAEKLGLRLVDEHPFHDLIVIGSGPAGLTAALYAARDGFSTLVIERGGIGGQAGVTERLDNFPGFPEGISGDEFANRLRDQATRFGVEILQAQEVTSIELDGQYQLVRTQDDSVYHSSALLIATGSTYRRLDIPGEGDFIGSGVHFCATCDGPFYRDQEVLVIGAGNTAGEESIFLARHASKVTIATRGEGLRASKVIQQKVTESPKIDLLPNVAVTAFEGENRLERVVLQNRQSGESLELAPAGVFVFIGLQPNSDLARGLVETDDQSFIITDRTLATNAPGIFAAGDVRAGSTKQAASAAGEGATAALEIRSLLDPRR
jgi:thioredoxin reductase (NADPH)